MPGMNRRWVIGLVLLAASAGASGCAGISAKKKSSELERVAKDWCLTIRASQVMPAYPLTRDLQPGDVFLTTTPIGNEVSVFEEKGFLPLDVHLVRLPVLEKIDAFYKQRTGEGDKFPGPVSTWKDLPAAAFPTYSFEVSRGGGLNMALPIEGVPVGFSYLGSAAATATVVLKDAQTMGVDIETMQPLLDAWRKKNQSLLAAYSNNEGQDSGVFVRVVTRVYRVSKIRVHLNDSSSGGASAAAGVALPTPDPGTPDAQKPAAQRFAELSEKLNAVAGPQFGANLKFVSVGTRAVAMDEDFEAPMVFGYIAYDCLILPGGVLSAPMPTFYRVSGAPIAQPKQFDSSGLLTAWYTADEPRAQRIREWIQSNVADPKPNFVDFMAQDKWDEARWRAIYDLGVLPR